MEDNLSRMVEDEFGSEGEETVHEEEMLNATTPYVEPEAAPADVNAEASTEDITPPATALNTIAITNLQVWLAKNAAAIPGYTGLDVKTAGIDTNEILIFKLPIPGCTDAEKRDIFLLKKPYTIKIPDLPCVSFSMLDDDSFKVIQEIIPEVLYIRSYSSKSVLYSTICLNVNNQLIPIEKVKLKKKETDISYDITAEIAQALIEKFREKLVSTLNIEDVCVLYKQTTKVKDTLKTFQDVLSWMMSRHNITKDINHLIQIDGVLNFIFTK